MGTCTTTNTNRKRGIVKRLLILVLAAAAALIIPAGSASADEINIPGRTVRAPTGTSVVLFQGPIPAGQCDAYVEVRNQSSSHEGNHMTFDFGGGSITLSDIEDEPFKRVSAEEIVQSSGTLTVSIYIGNQDATDLGWYDPETNAPYTYPVGIYSGEGDLITIECETGTTTTSSSTTSSTSSTTTSSTTTTTTLPGTTTTGPGTTTTTGVTTTLPGTTTTGVTTVPDSTTTTAKPYATTTLPTETTTPSGGTLPDTGGSGIGTWISWGIALIVAGAVLLLTTLARRRARHA